MSEEIKEAGFFPHLSIFACLGYISKENFLDRN